MAVKKNLKDKPNDPARFEDRKARFRSGVPENQKGFGILGGTIDIESNGLDPRKKTGLYKKSKVAQDKQGLSQGVDESKADLDESALNLNSTFDRGQGSPGEQMPPSPLDGNSTELDNEPSLTIDVDDETTVNSERTKNTIVSSTPVSAVSVKVGEKQKIKAAIQPKEGKLELE